MKVLIVDKDKNFGKAMTRLLKKDKKITKVEFYNNLEQTYSLLKQPR